MPCSNCVMQFLSCRMFLSYLVHPNPSSIVVLYMVFQYAQKGIKRGGSSSGLSVPAELEQSVYEVHLQLPSSANRSHLLQYVENGPRYHILNLSNFSQPQCDLAISSSSQSHGTIWNTLCSTLLTRSFNAELLP
jgi:hypothetical protein